jgi:hypothetical protein
MIGEALALVRTPIENGIVQNPASEIRKKLFFPPFSLSISRYLHSFNLYVHFIIHPCSLEALSFELLFCFGAKQRR